MAFRLRSWTLLRSGLRGTTNATAAYTTSTGPKMKAYTSPTVADFEQAERSGSNKVPRTVKKRGDFIPVYVALGMILLSASFGLHTAKQQLLYSPTVHVKKSKRETLPDVEDPDGTLEEAEKFIKKSFFRRIAHVKEFPAIPDPTRGDVLSRPLRAETLKDVGVDPKLPKVHAKAS